MNLSKYAPIGVIILIIAFFILWVWSTATYSPITDKLLDECIDKRLSQNDEESPFPVGSGEDYIKSYCCSEVEGIPIISIGGQYVNCIHKELLES